MDLQIGVIGLGAIGRDHVKRLSQRITGCKVVAVSEVNEAVGPHSPVYHLPWSNRKCQRHSP